LLFLHGTCASSSQYNGLLQALADGLDPGTAIYCHLYDAISCGKSPLVKDWGSYHTDQGVLDLKAVIDSKLNKAVPTILVGHSYAPTVIIRYLHRHGVPSNVKGCILLSSAMAGKVNPIPNGGHPIFNLPVFVLRCLQSSMTKSFLEMAYHPNTSPDLIQAANDSNSGNDMYMAKAYHTHHLWVTAAECASLHEQVPILVLHGKDDRILPAEAGECLADAVKAKRFLTVDETSHQVLEEKPAEVAGHILDFLKEL
jgi:pimeloyl-ACP methyl ester carboxylesterase